MTEKIIFWVFFFLAYTLNAITGFAGNIIAMPVGINTLGVQESIAALNIAGCCACGVLAFQDFKCIDWKQLIRMMSVMVVFMCVGIWLDTIVSLFVLKKIFAVFVLAVGIRNTFFPKRKGVPEWALWVALVLAGILQGMFVCGGAMLVIYATQKLPEKDQFRATLSMNWFILNLLYSLYSWHAGYMTPDVGVVIAGCIPLLVIATVLGGWIHRRISQEGFVKFTYVMLIVIGGIMLFV